MFVQTTSDLPETNMTFRETISFRKVFYLFEAHVSPLHSGEQVRSSEKAQSILPPLCKGRWQPKADERVVVCGYANYTTPQSRQASTAPLTQGSQDVKRRRIETFPPSVFIV